MALACALSLFPYAFWLQACILVSERDKVIPLSLNRTKYKLEKFGRRWNLHGTHSIEFWVLLNDRAANTCICNTYDLGGKISVLSHIRA